MSMKEKIWLSSPHMGTQEQVYVAEAFRSNWIAPLGPLVNQFEEKIEAFTGVPHAVALSSGTAALHLALVMLEVGVDDLVICQSETFAASANPIVYQGATPVFIDSEPDTWNMDPEALLAALSDIDRSGDIGKVKAIIPVHLYGHPAKMKDILEIAERYNIPVIEDAAEALGSTLHGIPCGAFGKMAVLSFNGNKIITCSGGGALLSPEQHFADKALFLATQARDPAPHYQHSHIGYNYRLSNVMAGIGMGQMEVLPDRVEARRNNYHRYRTYFKKWEQEGFDLQWQEEAAGEFSNRWLTCVQIDPAKNKGYNRETLRLAMDAENIECRPLWKPMHMQPVFERYPFYGGQVSNRLFENGLCLPSGSNLCEADFERIFSVLDAQFDQYRTKIMSTS
jgi:dTDP-4-amino-4,6-dideoxygalactose transaminase